MIRFAAAAFLYAGFAVYLYQPYFKGFKTLRPQDLFVVNVCLASLGCFVLSRRWVSSFCGSLFAGALYGFGSFLLYLANFHAAGLLAAAVPWLFCPAAFGPKGKWQALSWSLAALPFLTIPLFFEVSTYSGFFPLSINTRPRVADLAGIVAPLVVAKRGTILVGFYHIPIASLTMGFTMLLKARRFGIVIIFAIGTALAFCNPFVNVSLVIWLAIPVLCCSIIIGAGMQGLACAGRADRGWILLPAAVMAALAIVTLLLATKYFQVFLGLGAKYARLLVEAAKIYILGAVAVTIIFFLARAKLRLHWLRWIILCSATGLDLFWGARFIVDRIF
ncbi:MAG: hypothetical protein ACYSTG_06615 [Planctomycetota bacterium]